MACCKFCGDDGRWRTLRPGTRHFFHQNHDCAEYLARRLVAKRRRLTYESFTRPTECEICGGECFYYENEFGSKVFFDELGPPWPKHDCIERQAKRPQPPYRWEIEGYEPCLIVKAIPVVHLQRLVVYVRGLKSEINLALRVSGKDIRPFIARLHQPFLLRRVGSAVWELNTYAQFYDHFESRLYKCPEAQCAWPVPPEPPIPWF